MLKTGKHLLISLTLLIAGVQLYSQDGPTKEVTIASPTAASLGKYADVPVSYHTGQPQINIPLYTIKEGSLSLPVGLSYYSGGLKVMEPASWVGAAWSLQAGGVITRSVVGGPDEYNTNTSGNESHGYFSHYGYNSYLYANNQQDWQSIANGYKDGEPDLFFFNFNGISGKFFFSDDRTPILLPEGDLKIEYDYTLTGSNSIQSFIITTSDGTRYFFGKTISTTDVDPVERTLSYTAENGTYYGNIISSWYLNKIESADGQFSISLSYQAERYGYYTTSMYPIDGNKSGAGYKNTGYMLVKNIMEGVRLSQITFSNGNLTFNAGTIRTDLADNGSNFYDGVNTSAATLGNIQINGTGGLCKKFIFSYNYFTDNTTSLAGDYALMNYSIQTDKKRLRLESVQESTCTGEMISPHQFIYFTEKVPRMLSFGIDHWGFYNDANNQGLIPTYTKDNVSVPGANRDASWPAMRGGALQKIIYPTGGYTSFDFEPHNLKTSTTSYKLSYVAGMIVNQGGQSQLTHSVPFTVTNTGNNVNNCKFTVNNNSPNWAPTLSIKNSSNTEQAGGPWLVNFSSSYSQTITLPPGDYTATLSFPSNSGSTLINGADAKIEQWKYQTTQSIATIGGLRIKSITNNDGVTNKDVVTSFDYTAGGGPPTLILYGRPTYVQQIRNDLIREVGYWKTSGFTPYVANPNGCPTGGGMFYKSAGSLRPMGSTQGNHVGYFEVRKKQTGQGYSIYRYDGTAAWNQGKDDVANRVINTTICDPNTPNYPAAPLPFDPKRGDLKYEGYFNEAGQMLQEKSYLSFYENSTITTPGFIVHARQFGSATELLGTFYTLQSAKKVREEVIETVNTPGVGNVTSTNTVYFGSAFHNEPTLKTATGSKAETLETRLKYAFDYRISNCETVSNCTTELTNALAACQSNYDAARAACNGSSSCLTTAYLNYLSCQNQARINYINCRKSNFTNTINAFKTCHDNAKASANADLKPILELQDNNNNALIESSQWKNNNLLAATFTKFDYGLNAATNVYPNKMQSLRLFSPSGTFSQSAVSNNVGLSKDSRYADEILYKFDKGNIVEQAKVTDAAVVYLWGYQGKYPVAKIIGATYTEARAIVTQSILDNPSSDAALITELNKLRSNLTSALVTTYTYCPLKGITTETNPAGSTIYYDYDGFGRLQFIRDRDKNVVKRICYNYAGQEDNCTAVANWSKTGATRCQPCPSNGSYATNIQEHEEKDLNPNSPTYNTTKWVSDGVNSSCEVNAAWQNTATAIRCKLNSSGENTGEQEQEQKDMNPCSTTYNQLRWVVTVTNTTACPTPPVWTATGATRCQPCSSNGSYYTNIREHEEKDTNAGSATYNTTKWVSDGVNSSCEVNASWQNTATAIRCKLNSSGENTGEQEQEQKDMNPCSATYNQLRWVVTVANTAACPQPPVWTATGATRCQPCSSNSSYNTNIREHEEKDTNAGSATYNTTKWVSDGVNSSCSDNAVWQNTSTPLRCTKDNYNQNTGFQEQEQKDVNPCSATFNQLRWTTAGANTSTCPLPCSFSMSSGYYSPTSNIQVNGSNVSFYLAFVPSSTMSPGSSYKVATINGDCRPTATRTVNYSSGSRSWTITIYSSGEMWWKLSSSSPALSGGSSVTTNTLKYTK